MSDIGGPEPAGGRAAATSAAPAPVAPPAAITMVQVAMLTVVAVASLRSLPAMSTYGLGSITLFVLPAVLFLVPTALVAAELATGWHGGVYVWVREALGNRWGFQAIWLQWIQNVVWYPVQLAFVAASIAFMFDASLANSGIYTAIVILVIYWASTLLTLRGGNLFAKVGSWGGIIGTLAPGLLLILLGVYWLADGEKSQVPLEGSDVIPPFTGFASIVLIVSNFLAYAGMEVNAVHANQMKDPGRQYPKAIFIASGVILVLFILPTIAVALAVPKSELGLTTGINLAFSIFFEHLGIPWATVVISAAIALGAIASVVTWIAGPSRGLLAAAQTGLLPPALQKRNKANVQVGILAVQGIIVSLLALPFLIIPNVSGAFVTLVDMAAALYLIMYMLMFASVIVLRRKAPDVKRTYRVPALPLVAGVGFAASLVGFIFSFIPPDGVSGIPSSAFPFVMVGVVLVLGVPPLLFYALRKPAWDLRAKRGGD
jgi:glutamate:GABA antiporter